MLNAAYGGLTPGAAGLLIEVAKPPGAKAWGDIVTPDGADYSPRKPFGWFGAPAIRGRQLGVTPLIADAVRQITEEWNGAHPERQLSPMQVQAIVWVQWLKMHPAQQKRAAVKEAQRATIAAALAATA